jgi:ribosomal protein S18 acetylase RimI-like enzyme
MPFALENLFVAEITSPAGALRLRPERKSDEQFRFELFCESRPDLALLPLDTAAREHLMRLQFRAQSAGYFNQFPNARSAIVELDGTPVGRVMLHESADELRLVDIAVASLVRNRGIGTALLHAVMDVAGSSDVAVRLSVSAGNPAALRLYLRLGFKPIASNATDTELQWSPSAEPA